MGVISQLPFFLLRAVLQKLQRKRHSKKARGGGEGESQKQQRNETVSLFFFKKKKKREQPHHKLLTMAGAPAAKTHKKSKRKARKWARESCKPINIKQAAKQEHKTYTTTPWNPHSLSLTHT